MTLPQLHALSPTSLSNHSLVGSNSSQSGPGSSCDDCPASADAVPWQSALWGLFALGLTVMMQRSASPLSAGFANLAPDRLSPALCAADSVAILLWLGLSYGRLGLRRALRSYYESVLPHANEPQEPAPAGGSTIVYLMLMSLGPLPQFIKLVSFSGIPLTQACAWIYLVSYLLSAATSWASSNVTLDVTTEDAENIREMTDASLFRQQIYFLYLLGYISEGVFWLYIGIRLSGSLSDSGQLILFWLLACLLFFSTLYVIVFIVYLISNREALYPMLSVAAVSLFFISASVFYFNLLQSEFFIKYITPIFGGIVVAIMLIGFSSGCYSLITLTQFLPAERNSTMPEKASERTVSLLLACINISIACTGYAYLYNSAGTAKSSWTNVFG
jgi:hypothetical protein